MQGIETQQNAPGDVALPATDVQRYFDLLDELAAFGHGLEDACHSEALDEVLALCRRHNLPTDGTQHQTFLECLETLH